MVSVQSEKRARQGPQEAGRAQPRSNIIIANSQIFSISFIFCDSVVDPHVQEAVREAWRLPWLRPEERRPAEPDHDLDHGALHLQQLPEEPRVLIQE